MIGKILITGSKGYLGSHLFEKLALNYEVVEYNRGDDLGSLIKGCDIVYHFASNVNLTEKVIWNNIENDLHLTINLLEKCVENNVKTIFYASSGGTVYGPARGPIKEEHTTVPISPYGMLKLTIENYIKFYCDLYNFNYVLLRISNPYGGNTKKGIIYHILNAMKEEKPFILWGDGSHVRDFIYIDDLIKAVILLGFNLHGTFNIGTGRGTSIKKLIEIIQQTFNKKLKIIKKPRRLIDNLYNVLDNTKLINSVNWLPQTDLTEGINLLKEK